ncbi:molybdopterin synthase catalytic subunit MoaE [Paraglaciecola aestuariivivens]
MAHFTKIKVQNADFDMAMEYQELRLSSDSDGAIVTFVGLVRDTNLEHKVTGLFLEHYPGMTEKSLQTIVDQAREKWPVGSVSILHRVGNLGVSEQIVFVGVTSKHRLAAYQANEFIMDYLKTHAPFWKKEHNTTGSLWLEAKTSDQEKAQNW